VVHALGMVALALALASLVVSYLRWLRVAQREHYLTGTTSTFAKRWWGSSVANSALLALGVAGALASLAYPVAAVGAAVAAGAGPIGLGIWGKTSRLAWTPRMKRLAATCAGATAIAVGAAAAAGADGAASAAALCAIGAPLLVDCALWCTSPLEARLLAPFVRSARRRMAAVSPRVVAVTGSFGKTTTKGYIAHLLGGSFSVLATPASFNNAKGLATAVNQHLAPGTEVFVAEMGTYGAGEIRAMCEWVTPEVAVITAIGPVHLERMRSLENIAEAKAEILEKARFAVLNVDYPLLARLAGKAEAEGKAVWRCSSRRGAAEEGADVVVTSEEGKLRAQVARTGTEVDVLFGAGPEVSPGNVACALAAALCLGAPSEVVCSRLDSLPGAEHRRSSEMSATGACVIDDTYNSNPAGAEAALGLLSLVGAQSAKRVVVTPGMIELGASQRQENERFAERAGQVATELVVVGRTNAKALVEGARRAGLPVQRVRDRAGALAWMSVHLGPRDAVLYENDLPDHYP
jgi:UDP-N-acetylmuramoyl-tripeptide--D-alanyl-D-alanine ligase